MQTASQLPFTLLCLFTLLTLTIRWILVELNVWEVYKSFFLIKESYLDTDYHCGEMERGSSS